MSELLTHHVSLIARHKLFTRFGLPTMSVPKYLDFDLQISAADSGYKAHVLTSPVGQAAVNFQVPFSDEELATFIQQLLQNANRQSTLFEKGMLRTFGGQLFDALFQGQLLVCLGRSLDEAQRQGATLRIKLRLTDAPNLVNLPWEYLYYATANRFLTLSTLSPLVHFLELSEPLRPLSVTPPVGILAIAASPSDLPQLDCTRELNNLQNSLSKLIEQQQVRVIQLQNPTLADLQRSLRQAETHVLHFIGHGVFDESTQDGQLALCDEHGRCALASAQELGKLIHNERSLRLVVLNACEGSRTSLVDPFAGAAQTLVQQGVPAVIAMQFSISDQAAITFAQEFYDALADGYPVDAAVTEARVAISTRLRGGEWATPKLFMRADDGVLWQLNTGQATPSLTAPPGAQPITALVDLMRNEKVRAVVAAFRTDLQATNQQIEMLNNYKSLHDLLHKLQFRCYSVIAQELARFPQDTLAMDNLMDYEVTLQDIVDELRTLSKRATLPTSDVAWVDDVAQAQSKLHDAIAKTDVDALKRTIWLLKRVIALQPSGVNQRLNAAARALRLQALVEAMLTIRGALTTLKLASDKVTQFEQGVDALRGLNTRLAVLVEDHDNWQAVERILSRIEDVMVYDLNELALSWPDVQSKIDQLCRDNREEWANLLQQDSAEVSNAITGQNPSLIQRYFRRFRQRAGNRFYQVDIMLKDLCEELRNVGNPLASVLSILE